MYLSNGDIGVGMESDMTTNVRRYHRGIGFLLMTIITRLFSKFDMVEFHS